MTAETTEQAGSAPRRQPGTTAERRQPAERPSWRFDPTEGLAALRGLLARPLASYYLLISSAGLLLVIGLTMVFSATSVSAYAEKGSAFADLAKQGLYAFIGLVGFWLCQRLPAKSFRSLGGPVLAGSLLLLVVLDLLLVFQSLAHLKVARVGPLEADLLWLYIGPIGLQPSEIAKFGMVLWGAEVVARKGAAVGWWRELLMPLAPAIGLLFLLVGYNDLGTMLCLLAIVVGLLWAAGVRMRIFATLGAVGVAGIGLLIAAASLGAGSGSTDAENYRLLRLTAFLHQNDPKCLQSACYQLGMARAAIDHGGWFGVGLGKSVLKWDWLPQARNDFIYAILAEELGVVGCAVVLALLAVLAYTGLRIARRVNDPFRRLAAAAATTWLISQALINIGGVVGLLPITGLPLPFISDGGSALVVTLAAIGMLASFARSEPDAARALNARPPAPWVRLLWAPLPPIPGRRRPEPAADRRPGPKSGRRDTGARPTDGRVDRERAAGAGRGRRR
ncbi:FtsW/RodA/SpoVE family cell cycle protein [Plantactinospora siamensis]|uniref:Probable peptidoglycan glycosyltransferase FtsW n=1 Tax=Plantactinospora siamensis TaxID=555372 RepID=A0ABV6NZJ8_9ACTN